MAYIRKYTKADGTTIYKVEIVVKKDGQFLHRESKTFDRKKLATDWGMRREVELQDASVYSKRQRLLITDVIEQYQRMFNPEGRTKKADLLDNRSHP